MRYRLLKEDLFDYLVANVGRPVQEANTTLASKEVLVDGKSIVEASKKHKVSPPSVSKKIRLILERESLVIDILNEFKKGEI